MCRAGVASGDEQSEFHEAANSRVIQWFTCSCGDCRRRAKVEFPCERSRPVSWEGATALFPQAPQKEPSALRALRVFNIPSGVSIMATVFRERVLTVHHWTDTLFSFTTTRDPSFRFLNGQFTMIGIEVEGKPLMRAYSMVSANYEETLEFLSIKVPNGPLTSRLMHIQPGDTLLVNSKAVGTLILPNLLPGKNLYLLSTGTGMAPFMSVIKDPETYEHFEKVILVHGTRRAAELAYDDFIRDDLPRNEFFGELVADQLIYYPTVTREPYRNQGRITTLIETGKLQADIGLPPIDRQHDRVMICGSPEMLKDLQSLFLGRGWSEGSMSEPGHFVIERAFVEK